jgi:hypothetical protein
LGRTLIEISNFNVNQVALKRQQATEDAIAMGLRAVATGASVRGYLPSGPIFGMPVTEPHVKDGHKSDDDKSQDEKISPAGVEGQSPPPQSRTRTGFTIMDLIK